MPFNFSGLFAIPTADQELRCALLWTNDTANAPTDYVNGYCTREKESLFVRFLPYIMAVAPLTLIAVDRFTSK